MLRAKIFLGFSFILVATLLGIFLPFVLRYAIDDFTAGRMHFTRLVIYACSYLSVALLSGLFAFLMRYVILRVGYLTEERIRNDLFEHLTLLSRSYYRKERTGDIMTRMSSDLASVRELIGQGLLQGTRTLLGFMFSFGVMFFINVRLASFMALWLPSMSLLFFFLLRFIRSRYETTQEQFSVLSNFAHETCLGIRTIKGCALEEQRYNRFRNILDCYRRCNLSLSKVDRPLWPLMALLFSFGVALLILIGGRQVIYQELSLGEFVQFSHYLFFLQWPMLALGWTVNLLLRGLTSWKRIKKILEVVPDIRDGEWTHPSLKTVKGNISFQHVTLRIDGQTILKDIHLVIPEGCTVGITGPTGSGKTLLVSMIARIVEPTLGEIRIGSYDVKEYPLQVLRRHVGMAPQEPFLFSDTLARNIGLGLP